MALVRTRNETDGQGRKPVTLIHRNPEKLSDTQKQEMVDVGDVEKPSIDRPASVKPWLNDDDEIVWKATLRSDGDNFEDEAREELGKSKVRELVTKYPEIMRALERLSSEDRDRQYRGSVLLLETLDEANENDDLSDDDFDKLKSIAKNNGIAREGENVLVYENGKWVEDS